MKFVAARDKIAIPAEVSIDGGVGFEVELKISLPGMAREAAQTLVDEAHVVCPYSNATRGDIDLTLTIV